MPITVSMRTEVLLGWCGSEPAPVSESRSGCSLSVGSGIRCRGRGSDLGPLGPDPLGADRKRVGFGAPRLFYRPVSELGMKDERGSAVIWMVGLTALLLLFGGLSIDFWAVLRGPA